MAERGASSKEPLPLLERFPGDVLPNLRNLPHQTQQTGSSSRLQVRTQKSTVDSNNHVQNESSASSASARANNSNPSGANDFRGRRTPSQRIGSRHINYNSRNVSEQQRQPATARPREHNQNRLETGQCKRSQELQFHVPRRHTNSQHPLKVIGLQKLLEKSNEELTMILVNSENKFEELIKGRLELSELKSVLQILQKICQAEGFDKNKCPILSQACQAEFLMRFTTLLLQEISPEEISNLLTTMNEFFNSVICLMPATACDRLKSGVSAIYACAKGLSCQFPIDSDSLNNLESIVHSLDNIQVIYTKPNLAKARKRECMELNPPPNNFRDIDMYPCVEDILFNKQPYLRANKVQGEYNDVEHYLDVQFRLLREDYIRPLREGISDFLRGGSSNRKCESPSIKIYKNVKFIHYVKEDVKIPGVKPREGTLLSFTAPGKKPIDWEHSKRFMHGSLLCFTKNNFETLLFATVSDRDTKYLSDGQLLVAFCKQYDENIYEKDSSYIMMESEVFFEPYFQVLKTLKLFTEESFPMKEYIIKVKNSDVPPAYLINEAQDVVFDDEEDVFPRRRYEEQNMVPTMYTLYHATGPKRFQVNVLDESTWPTGEQLGLDPSQYVALRTALTSKLAVIQGPPGTGKTFMALHIAKTLVRRKRSDGTPILVVCLTNHALDQFLLGTLKFTKSVTRIGGQSKCEEMNAYNLRIKKTNRSSARSHLYYELRDAQSYMIQRLRETKARIDEISSKKGILPLWRFLEIDTAQPLLNFNLDGHQFFSWIFGRKLLISDYINPNEMLLFSDMRLMLNHYYAKSLNELQSAGSQYNWNENYLFHLESKLSDDCYLFDNLIDEQEYFIANENPPNEEQVIGLAMQKNLKYLKLYQRRQLYIYWVNSLEVEYQKTLREYENKILELNERIEEIRVHDDLQILRESDVVGLTTNGAARLHKVLNMLKCKIVIVEEAAEVMESHVVACLNNHCQHLILIGDHKQLRPNIATYALGKYYNFDVSLFERFVRNRGQCVTLEVQHRMAPEMAKLIVPTIYPKLENDASVLGRSTVSGLPQRLFFISHSELEEKDSEISSRRNEYEARFLLELCDHLILQDYEASQITILATYKGQMFYMKKEIRKEKYNRIRQVQVTVVDNFQGEENDIILLSLVRSNSEGRIGFLATENRLCVALSRARQAMYIIGNMDILSAASDTWKAVRASLEEQNCFGTALPLRCEVHPEQTFTISVPEDFKRFAPEGGCSQICTFQLHCGHMCERTCHLMNRNHDSMTCLDKHMCRRLCQANLHPCEKRCNQPCGNCLVQVEKQLPCKHFNVMPCWQKPENYPCNENVIKEFEACNHKETVLCFQTKCPHPCENRLPCGHQCVLTCHIENDPDHLNYICDKPCTKFNENCKSEHACPKLCHENCDNCTIQVKRKLKCAHEFEMKCTDDPDSIKCLKKCKKILTCGHWCTRKCHETCEPCQKQESKIIEFCQHEIKIACATEPTREHCKEKCERVLCCGHPCTKYCSEDCTLKCLLQVDNVIGLCGHLVPLLCWEKTTGLKQPTDLKRCQTPCNADLICGHKCKGNCFSCRQGRLHVPCKETCNRKFVCGHSCRELCYQPCRQCHEDCNNYCLHQQCYQKCALTCKPCKKNCSWFCDHYKCTQQCGKICNRPCCDEPCKEKMKKCEHNCPGLCGEICPDLCWICDKDLLMSEAMVQDVHADYSPRFVVLPDCKHVVEVVGLENWLMWQEAEMCIRSCPRCDTPIRTFPRYTKHLTDARGDLSSVQQRLFFHRSIANKKVPELNLGLSYQLRKFKSSSKGLFANLIHFREDAEHVLFENQDAYGKVKNSAVSANLIEVLDLNVCTISNLCLAIESCHGLHDDAKLQIENVSNFILEVIKKEKYLGMQVAHDVGLEILRLHHMVQGLHALKSAFFVFNQTNNELQFIKHMMQPKRYTQEMQETTLNMLKHWGIHNIPDFQIKVKIPVQPLKSLWKKCPNNHLNFSAFVPTSNTSCDKCSSLLLSPVCPKFKKADPPILQTTTKTDSTSKGKAPNKFKGSQSKTYSDDHDKNLNESSNHFSQDANMRRRPYKGPRGNGRKRR